MSVRNIAAAHVCCDHDSGDGPRCHAVIVAGWGVAADKARAVAVLRGWRCDDTGDRCPSHLAGGVS